jgi:hypothetical protein
VVQEHRDRDPPVQLEPDRGQQAERRIAEAELALVDELEDQRRGEGLAHARDRERGVGRHGLLRPHEGEPADAGPAGAVREQDRRRDARDAELASDQVELRLETLCEVRGALLGRGGAGRAGRG